MAKYTRIPVNTFDTLQMDAGLLLKTFDVTGATEITEADIICATTGGINPTCVPTYSDMGEDVDNCPINMKELKHLDGWDVKLGFTALSVSADVIRLALGAADITNGTKVTPRRNLHQTDFADLWWVGDKTDGGFVAIRIINGLSTGGLSLQTTKNGKGQLACEITGHVSMNAQNTMPMECYVIDGEDVNALSEISLNYRAVTLTVDDTLQLIATTVPAGETVTWSTGSGTIATVSNGLVTAKAAGNTIVTASITVDGVTYTETCTVVVVSAA